MALSLLFNVPKPKLIFLWNWSQALALDQFFWFCFSNLRNSKSYRYQVSFCFRPYCVFSDLLTSRNNGLCLACCWWLPFCIGIKFCFVLWQNKYKLKKLKISILTPNASNHLNVVYNFKFPSLHPICMVSICQIPSCNRG